MKIFAFAATVASILAPVIAQTIDIGYPTDGTVFNPGQSVNAQILRPDSIIGCTEVGIALAIDTCSNGTCPSPSDVLGSVLYSGPFKPTAHAQQGFYQNFTVQIPSGLNAGEAIFTLTHLCLLGAGPTPLLEYRNASVTIS
ncbi:hypothetical protein SERLA73DRAFT_144906 [Serpula lacrymans var. lacrymans S7.3]|uniref:Phosphatidylglycerol/phosphatidylinositol transfer protein n=2 Tax=Serpula lacrymans var. lacrymans TaxID=341189 RepID=F8QCM5_SERL3|nr:uncharacterized protein SERLADRAFT_479634 [Serpula lacrymans var. lacrymans S7.9]EGN93890.1 hypothetical protein SERLA73DRAFT_144906 [Serpula lacrymans var. lacrymans S7.3]EGO19255.1 hypothetical protein SERLADRAFT_479634 [Serpula lacrymans var. lacrymans S7.9]